MRLIAAVSLRAVDAWLPRYLWSRKLRARLSRNRMRKARLHSSIVFLYITQNTRHLFALQKPYCNGTKRTNRRHERLYLPLTGFARRLIESYSTPAPAEVKDIPVKNKLFLCRIYDNVVDG